MALRFVGCLGSCAQLAKPRRETKTPFSFWPQQPHCTSAHGAHLKCSMMPQPCRKTAGHNIQARTRGDIEGRARAVVGHVCLVWCHGRTQPKVCELGDEQTRVAPVQLDQHIAGLQITCAMQGHLPMGHQQNRFPNAERGKQGRHGWESG